MKIVYDDGLVRIALDYDQYGQRALVLFQCIQDAFGNSSWNRTNTLTANSSIHVNVGFENFLNGLPEVTLIGPKGN